MKKTLLRNLFLAFTLFFAVTFLSPAQANADTDGSELQVVQAEHLEIQLGTAWAGVEFQLRTDSGLYPNPIPVGEDGVLRLEIGGSNSYVLSCMGFTNAIPMIEPEGYGEAASVEIIENTPEPTAPETHEPPDVTSAPVENPVSEAPETQPATTPSIPTVSGIPIKHIIFFGAGILICCAILVSLRLATARREDAEDEDFYDYDE